MFHNPLSLVNSTFSLLLQLLLPGSGGGAMHIIGSMQVGIVVFHNTTIDGVTCIAMHK